MAKKDFVSPNAIVDKPDFGEVFPVVGASVGIDDITKVAEIYKNNKPIFDALFGFFKGLFKKSGQRKDGVAVPVVVDPPVIPPPVVVPAPPAPRRVAALRAKWYFIEIPKDAAESEGDIPNKNMKIASKSEFDAFVSGANAIPRRSRLHVDITPVDQFGVDFQPGDEANKLLLRPDGYPAFAHRLSGPVFLTNEYDDFGCTPVLKIPKDANLPERAAIRYSVALGEIVSNELGPVYTD